MADRMTIAARPRTVFGKHVQQLRRLGTLPANVYGRGLESRAIEMDAREFARTVKAGGIRSLYDLAIEGEAAPRPVVLRHISRAGGSGDPIHIDFFQVDPNRPIHATVPIRLVGDAPAVRDLAGTLLQSLDSLAIRCAPLAIPDHLDVDLGRLTAFDVSLTVADIRPPAGIEILVDPAVVIATVAAPRIRLEAETEEAETA